MSQDQERDKQHKADVIKGLWESLTSPRWDRDTLIEMGKLIYAQTPLKEMPKRKFDLLFPRLVEVADQLLTRFEIVPTKEDKEEIAAPPAEETK